MEIIKPNNTFLGKSITILVGFALLVIYTSIITQMLGLVDMWHPEPTIINSAKTFTQQIIISCFISPAWEELFFRYSMLSLAALAGPKATWPAVIFSSVLFALGHRYGPIGVVLHGVMGVVFSLTYLRSGLWAAIILHILWNLFAVLYP